MHKIIITGKGTLYRTEKELQEIKKDPDGTLIALIKNKKPTVISNPNRGEINIIIEGTMNKARGSVFSSAIVDDLIPNNNDEEEIKKLEEKCRELIKIITVTSDAFGPIADQDALDEWRLELKEAMIKIHKLSKGEIK